MACSNGSETLGKVRPPLRSRLPFLPRGCCDGFCVMYRDTSYSPLHPQLQEPLLPVNDTVSTKQSIWNLKLTLQKSSADQICPPWFPPNSRQKQAPVPSVQLNLQHMIECNLSEVFFLTESEAHPELEPSNILRPSLLLASDASWFQAMNDLQKGFCPWRDRSG